MKPKEIQKLIGKDLKEKIAESGKSKYYFWSNLQICSEPTLTSILNGRGGDSLNLKLLFNLYKALGYDAINIKDGDNNLIIKPV
jgi:hypothetical protein